MSYFSQNLKEGEEVVVVLRKHFFTFVWPLVKTIIIVLIPILLSGWLLSNVIGFYVFTIWLAVGIVYGIYQWTVWFFDQYIITNQRIIDIEQKSLFNRTVSEAGLDKIQDVTYEIDGFMATSLNYGTVKVQTAGAAQTIDLNQVARPQEVQDLIVDLQKAVGGSDEEPEKALSAEELVKFIARVKDGEEDGSENGVVETEQDQNVDDEEGDEVSEESESRKQKEKRVEKKAEPEEKSELGEKTGPQISDIKPRNKEK